MCDWNWRLGFRRLWIVGCAVWALFWLWQGPPYWHWRWLEALSGFGPASTPYAVLFVLAPFLTVVTLAIAGVTIYWVGRGFTAKS